jgi:hypothetical protein
LHLRVELLLLPWAYGGATGAPNNKSAADIEGGDDDRTRGGGLDVSELGDGQVETVLERENPRVDLPDLPLGICLCQHGYLGGLALEKAEIRENFEQLIEPLAFGEVMGQLAERALVAACLVPLAQGVGLVTEVGCDCDMRALVLLALMKVPLLHCYSELAVEEVQLARRASFPLGAQASSP